jgi:hypothetical protein
MERFEVCSVILGAKREHQRHRLLHPSEGSSLSLHFISDTNGSPVSSGSALTCPRTQVCPPGDTPRPIASAFMENSRREAHRISPTSSARPTPVPIGAGICHRLHDHVPAHDTPQQQGDNSSARTHAPSDWPKTCNVELSLTKGTAAKESSGVATSAKNDAWQ